MKRGNRLCQLLSTNKWMQKLMGMTAGRRLLLSFLIPISAIPVKLLSDSMTEGMGKRIFTGIAFFYGWLLINFILHLVLSFLSNLEQGTRELIANLLLLFTLVCLLYTYFLNGGDFDVTVTFLNDFVGRQQLG